MLTKLDLLLIVLVLCYPALAGTADSGLKVGTPDLKSAGPLAFGPNGILFIGDTRSAAVFAIDTAEKSSDRIGQLNVAHIDQKIAGLPGTTAGDIRINHLAINRKLSKN